MHGGKIVIELHDQAQLMSTVEDVTAALRQVAAHEARVVMLTERMDEMREHLDQAGLRLQAAESKIKTGASRVGT